MKKILLFLILLFSPLIVSASTELYYIDAFIKEDGGMDVREIKILRGEYNGIETILSYKNDSLADFDGNQNSFEGSKIYNASNLNDIKVYSVPVDKVSKTDGLLDEKSLVPFRQVEIANNGDFGVFTLDFSGRTIRSYQPSSYRHASVITYHLSDVVVLHNDIAEIAWDFIGRNYKETIEKLVIRIKLPRDSEELRVFSHGPLNGSNKIVNKSTVMAEYPNLQAGKAVDVRVVFDKSLVNLATKKSEVTGLDKILAVEEIRANKANTIRKRNNMIVIAVYSFAALLVLYMIIAVIKLELAKRKIRKNTFEAQYYREFIEDYPVEVIDYLLHKKITTNALSAAILDLIHKKNITFELAPNEKVNENIVLKKQKDSEIKVEQKLMDFLFNKVGKDNTFTLAKLKNYARNEHTYTSFISFYTDWKNEVSSLGIKQSFWIDKSLAIYWIVPIIMLIVQFLLIQLLNVAPSFLMIVVAIFVIYVIYLISYKIRSQKGVEHYEKWMAFKRFLQDFGQFKEKELPQIILWERYLVYATVLGVAKKLQKDMALKIKELNLDESTGGSMTFTDYYFINSLINNNVDSAVKGAYRTRDIQYSKTTSSSGGFGGGGSFGGGGFGGGGSGGGRF